MQCYFHYNRWTNSNRIIYEFEFITLCDVCIVVVVVVVAAVVVVVVVVVVELWLVTSVEADRFYEGQPVVADCLYHRVTYHNVI